MLSRTSWNRTQIVDPMKDEKTTVTWSWHYTKKTYSIEINSISKCSWSIPMNLSTFLFDYWGKEVDMIHRPKNNILPSLILSLFLSLLLYFCIIFFFILFPFHCCQNDKRHFSEKSLTGIFFMLFNISSVNFLILMNIF